MAPPDALSTPRSPLNPIVLLTAGVVLLSAAATAVAACLADPPNWFLLMFEVVVGTAALFGLLIGRSRYADGRGMALLCVAGAVGACSIFGYLTTSPGHVLMGAGMKPWLLGRVGAAGVFVAVAAWTVLSRRPGRSLPGFLKGSALLVGAAAVAAASLKFRGSLAPLPALAQVLVGLFVCVAFLACLAAGVHLTVRAFEAGRLEEGQPTG